MFTVQTQEVIPELNKIKELLAQQPQDKPVDIVDEKEIENAEQTKPISIKVEDTTISVEKKPDGWVVISSEWDISLVNTKTIEELRKEYTEKFMKKPFAWWSREVLISKMQ